jgi:drug/metabolite transporter (DMT)-like permease
VSWSVGGLLIKMVDWNPIAIAGTRSAVAGLFLLLVGRRPRLTWSGAQIGASLAHAATIVSFAVANKLTTAANAVLLPYTAPVFIALVGQWFLGERATRADWLMIAAVLGGLWLFFVDDLRAPSALGSGAFWGDVISLFAGITFAAVAVLLRKQKNARPMDSLLLGMMISALVCLPLGVRSLPDSRSLLLLVVLGVFQLGLSWYLYGLAISHVTALDSVLILTLEPILSPLWVLLALGERPDRWALVGGAVVVAAVLTRSLHAARHRGVRGPN